MIKTLDLQPMIPDKELRAIRQRTGSFHLTAVGPRGGVSSISIPASEAPKLAAFLGS